MGKENKPCEYERGNCVAGRRNSEVAPVVTAVAGAGGAAVVAFAKDDQTRFIAASSFFTLAKDLGNLLNGTDATIAAGEIFNMHFTGPLTVCLRPEDKKTAQ